MPSNNEPNRPVHQVRWGNLKAAIWLNETDNGRFYNVTLSRSYKDGEDWHDTGSFGFDDLLVLAKVLDECHTWIHHTLAKSNRPAEEPTGNSKPPQRASREAVRR
jgi:hypothetical protein